MNKYKEFQEKRAAIRKEQGIVSDFYMVEVAQKYYQLLGEVLEEFKILEENLEWRKKVEATEWGDTDNFETEEEREEWNNLMIKFTKRN